MEETTAKGLVVEVRRHAVRGGPSFRTVVLLGGCPLRCRWCPIPEAPHGSAGEWTIDTLMEVLARDREAWGPHGGVTFSGGEPVAQRAFLTAAMLRCKKEGMHVALETTAVVPARDLLGTLPFAQWVIVDVKHIDRRRHLEGTGQPNDLVVDNLFAARSFAFPIRLIVRVTIVPGFNDDADHATRTAGFLSGIGLQEVLLRPYEPPDPARYARLGVACEFPDLPAPTEESLEPLAEIYRAKRLRCHVGFDPPL